MRYLLGTFLLVTLFSVSSWSKDRPIENGESLGWKVGFQKVVVTDGLKIDPVDLESSGVREPIATLQGSYQPNYKALFQPDVHLAVSFLENSGAHFYLQGGGWFDFEKFHLFVGGEFFTTIFNGDLEQSAFASDGRGVYVKGGVPLGRFYPMLEIRYRELGEVDLSTREGLTTKLGHSEDFIYRAHLNYSLESIELWASLGLYSVGNTAIASDGFAIGIKEKNYPIYSIGAGTNLDAISARIWLKYHIVSGIDDEQAFYYQVPQIYPDFLPAKQSATLEVSWKF